jgi:Protein of unknown function (DUF2877)
MIAETRASSYSAAIAKAVVGTPQRGTVHSVFSAAANIVFPQGFVLSLNVAAAPRMPNGLQLTTPANTYPFSNLRPGMPVLLGAQRLHIEAIDCSLDLSGCSQWQPQIQRPEQWNGQVFANNTQWLLQRIGLSPSTLATPFPSVQALARYWCGRGMGLTPTGDDMLAGWMATNWLLHGPTPHVLHEHQQIIEVAKRQTHLLSQCWLRYAAQGDVAEPIGSLLLALTQEYDGQLETATQGVLSLGATSGYDVIQGILLYEMHPSQ